MKPSLVTVHIIWPDSIPPDAARACLTADEIVRADRFHFPNDAIHWTACRAALRQILGHYLAIAPKEVPITYSEYGKPLLVPPLDSLHFNLTHCPDLALLAIAFEGPVGIDIESLDRAADLLSCEKTFCHPLEIAELPEDLVLRSSQLLRIWTSKEAVLKARGKGLSHSPELVQIHFGSSESRASSSQDSEMIESLAIRRLEYQALIGYCAYLAMPGSLERELLFKEHTFEAI
jgi:4'-phosphopantetheinyl transferase